MLMCATYPNSYYLVKFLGPGATLALGHGNQGTLHRTSMSLKATWSWRLASTTVCRGRPDTLLLSKVIVPARFLLYVIELEIKHDATADRPALYLPNGCSKRAARATSCVHVPPMLACRHMRLSHPYGMVTTSNLTAHSDLARSGNGCAHVHARRGVKQ